MADVTITERLAQAMAETRAHSNKRLPTPQPTELRMLALALEGYAAWLERDPSTYHADGLAQTLEKVGVIEPNEWRPAPWVIEAVKAMHG